jgi:replicative DNA helicase
LPDYNPERGFISKLLETKDMTLVKDQQIKPSFFSGDHRSVFAYIQEQFEKTGEVLTPRVVNLKFPYYRFETHSVNGEEKVGNDEGLIYWCDEMRSMAKYNILRAACEGMSDNLSKRSIEEAYEQAQKAIWNINNEIIVSTSVDITQNTKARKELYLSRKQNKGIVGIPTGFGKLDFLIKGFVKGTLTTMISRTGLGKSWLMCLVGVNAMLNNYKVIQFKTEMPTELMQDRYESLLYSKIYGELNYNQMKMGSLPPETEQSYLNFLDKDMPALESLLIETAIDIGTVEAKIQSEKPDLVLIDSVYLMNDVQKADNQDWLRVAHITRGLKKIAERYNVPIFINSQADKSSSVKTGPEIDNISYSQSIGMDSDTVLALYQDNDMFREHEIGLKVLKNREGMTGKIILHWDFRTMNFSEIDSEIDNQQNIIEVEG